MNKDLPVNNNEIKKKSNGNIIILEENQSILDAVDKQSSESDEYTEEEYEEEITEESLEKKPDNDNNKLQDDDNNKTNNLNKQPIKVLQRKKRRIKKPELGFIITRCVKKPQHDLLWKECYDCIRKFYNNKIIIIDDNSNQSLITKNKQLIDTKIIQSEFPGAGELLPYYYFYKLHPFKRAIIMHDSMFFKSKVEFDKIEGDRYLWHFRTHSADNIKLETQYISYLNNSEGLLQFYRSKKWFGCFGAASFISYEFVKILNDKYNFFILCKHVKNRVARCGIERMIGLMMYFEKRFKGQISIFGEIFSHPNPFRVNFQFYKTGKVNIPLVKVWNSR